MTKPTGNLASLSADEKRELLAALVRRRLAAGSGHAPLTPGQRALWLLHQMAPNSSAYNIAFTARIVSPVDLSALRHAFQRLVERHDALRTAFCDVDGEPMRRIHPVSELAVDVIDASEWSRDRVYDEISKEIKRPFDLAAAPLMRVRIFSATALGSFLAMTFHHIVMDGWSLWICLSELAELYRADVAGDPSRLSQPTEANATYTRWQADMRLSAEGVRHLEYWKKHLGATVPIVNVPGDRPRAPVLTFQGASHRFRIGADTTARLKRVAGERRATAQMSVLALFQILLQRWTGQEDLTVGYLSSGRSRGDLEHVVGYFANLLPLRLTVPATSTFHELLNRTRDTLLEAFDHQDYPFSYLVDAVASARDASRSPLVQVLFVYEKPQLLETQNVASFIAAVADARMKLGALELESLPFPIQQEGQFDLTLMVVEVDGEFCCTLDYNTQLFDASTIRRMGGHLQTLAQAAAFDPERLVSVLPMLSEQELNQLHAWRGADTDSGTGCVHWLFEQQAAARPGAVALEANGARLTYGELNAKANRLARFLQQLGVAADTPVGLLVERGTFDLVVGMIGILKAGGAFIPLDPSLPLERLRFMCLDATAPVVVTHSALRDRLPTGGPRIVYVDDDRSAIDAFPAENLPTTVAAANLAYVIYTSGSTGRPKGVLLEHRGLWNVAKEQQRVFNVGPGSRVIQFASLSFDAAVWEVVMALCSGGSLHLTSREALLPGLPLLETLKSLEITAATLPPSALANLPEDSLPELTTLMVAGEPCTPELVTRWAPGRRFFNLYGPTEATIWATYAECSDGSRIPPIGRPLANTQAFVLDANLQEVAVGIPGELHLGGVGVARGYLNRPELTASRFIANPSATRRAYKTGDIVRRGEDGQLFYLGRADSQVKLRGFRIELEEIEAALSRHPQVTQAVVVLHEDATGGGRLVAYVMPRSAPPPSAPALRRFLQADLPDYMLPAAFVLLDEFPINASGKVDRLALPRLKVVRQTESEYSAPSGDLENSIAAAWKDVLGLDVIGADDHFFDIGGNSLLVARVHARLKDIAPSEVSVVDLFQFPTIRSLAAHLAPTRSDSADGPAADRSRALTAGHARLRDQARRRGDSRVNQTIG